MRPAYVLVACAGMLVFLLTLAAHTGYLGMSKATTPLFFNRLSPPANGADGSPQEAGSLLLDTVQSKPGHLSSSMAGPPSSSKYGLPSSSKSGPPPSSKFGLPSSSKLGLQSSSKQVHPSPSKSDLLSLSKPGLLSASKSGRLSPSKPKPEPKTVHKPELVSQKGHKPESASSKEPHSKPVSLERHTYEPVFSEGLYPKPVSSGFQKTKQLSAEKQNPKLISSEGNKPETVISEGDNPKHAPQEVHKPEHVSAWVHKAEPTSSEVHGPESSSPVVHNSVPEPPGGIQLLLEPHQTRLPEPDSPGVQKAEPLPGKPAADNPRRVDTGEYPHWWRESWPRSVVADLHDEYVGDKPLFASCSNNANPWEAYNFVEPFSYVKTSKNPCWFEQPEIQRRLHCLPYFYLAGVAKCGTSDISRRLRMHPDVYTGTRKEYHWWERTRYGLADDDDPEAPVDFKDGTPFDDYTDQIAGRAINNQENDIVEKGFANRIFGDYSPSYLWDPRNWHVLDGNQNCLEPRVIVGQHIHHVFPRAKILLTFRHPTPRLYSRFLSRIRRVPFLRGATPEDFHVYVADSIKRYKDCFKLWSIRHCAYNVSNYRDSNVRLVEGMYPVFMADWLRVWPREQMFFLRYEDYPGREVEHVNQMVAFLGLAPYSAEDAEEVAEHEVVNSGAKEYDRIGQMLNSTRALLDDFYQPFITKFAHILNDRRFLWLDVPH